MTPRATPLHRVLVANRGEVAVRIIRACHDLRIDIVKEQIRVAGGERLRIGQGDVRLRGHAVECRINAENSEREFAPSPGEMAAFLAPGGPGIRVDSHLFGGIVFHPTTIR